MSHHRTSQRLGAALGVLHAAFLALLLRPAAAAGSCQKLLDRYLFEHQRDPRPYNDDSTMVYFLHVPRTAGRTFHSCMLKLGTPPTRRCPKAYDHLRLNMSVPNCYLLSSHDDYSIVSMLPDNVAVLTHLRDPVDRFLSAYEFAIEVGSRAVHRPANFRKRPDKVATDDVWPWSYLVPWFTNDVKMRMDKLRQVPEPETGHWVHVKHPDGDEYYYNKVKNLSKWNLTDEEKQLLLPELDPYDNPMVMSLREFTRHPIAKELLHNGQTFQVLGITNYSHWGDATEMRSCFWQDPHSQDGLLNKARSRVQKFIHVGVTDRLAESVTAAAAAMRFSLDGPAYGGGDEDIVANVTAAIKPQSGDSQSDVKAADLPDLADKVREARTKLQEAQRQLFQASQRQSDDDTIIALKSKVGNLRVELRELQDLLVAARSKLPTSTDPNTEGNKVADKATRDINTLKKLGAPLGIEYQRCATRAQARNFQRRDTSLAVLSMPGDGRTVAYGKSMRKFIPPELIEEIRQLNLADTALHRLGTQILEQNRRAWASDGRLQELTPLPPMRPMPRPPFKFPIPKPQDEAPPADEL